MWPSSKPMRVATFPLKLATLVEMDDAASSIPTSVCTFSGKVATLVGIHDAASRIPTRVSTFAPVSYTHLTLPTKA